jgi:hypothetical protein
MLIENHIDRLIDQQEKTDLCLDLDLVLDEEISKSNNKHQIYWCLTNFNFGNQNNSYGQSSIDEIMEKITDYLQKTDSKDLNSNSLFSLFKFPKKDNKIENNVISYYGLHKIRFLRIIINLIKENIL